MNEMEHVEINFFVVDNDTEYPCGTAFRTDQMISFDNIQRIIDAVMIADNGDALGIKRIEVTYHPSVEGIKESLFSTTKKKEAV